MKTVSTHSTSQDDTENTEITSSSPPSLWSTPNEDFWKENLEPIEYRVLRGDRNGKENAYLQSQTSSLYANFFPSTGYFACRGCGLPLFAAPSKFVSSSSSNKSVAPTFGCCVDNNVRSQMICLGNPQSSHQLADTECARCEGHLGHVCTEVNPTPLDSKLYFREKHTVNGLCLSYVKHDLPSNAFRNDRAVVFRHPPSFWKGDKALPLYQ